MWFMYVDIGVYCCMIVVMMWFMCQFLFMNVEGCIWCGVFNVGKLWYGGNDCVDYVVKLSLVYFVVFDGVVQ